MTRSLLAMALVVLIAGCGSSPTAPASLDLTGTWMGTLSGVHVTAGNPDFSQSATVTLTQSGSSVSGRIDAGGSAGMLNGTLERGGNSGWVFGGTLTASYSGCQATAAIGGPANASTLHLSSVGFTGCPGALPMALRLEVSR